MNFESGITIAVLLVLLLGALLFALAQHKALEERMARQAEKRGGQVRKGGLFKNPELLVPFKGSVIVIRSVPGSRHNPPKTLAQLKLDAPRLPEARLLRNGLWQKALAAFGRERQLTGDEDFDKLWALQTDDPSAVQRFASAELKLRLEERILRTLDVRLQPQWAQFTITAIPSNDEAYDQFVETVLFILQRFL